jgi:hypothetical protein
VFEVAGGLVSTFPLQPIFKELNQPVDQPLLPAYDVEATLVAVLLENFVQTALQIGHRLTPEGIQRNSAAALKAQQILTQDSGTAAHRQLSPGQVATVT